MAFLVGFLLGVALAGLACGAYGWSRGWRPFPKPPLVPRRAMLMNRDGRLDSTRTITGLAPPRIISRAGVYVLDRTAVSDHLIYRLTSRE